MAAYVTLVCGQIEAAENARALNLEGADYRYSHYPAVKIARLAVTTPYRRFGLGRRLVAFSLARAQDISGLAGCRFVVVDAKAPAVAFYENCGFRLLDTADNRARREPIMFFDLKGV